MLCDLSWLSLPVIPLASFRLHRCLRILRGYIRESMGIVHGSKGLCSMGHMVVWLPMRRLPSKILCLVVLSYS